MALYIFYSALVQMSVIKMKPAVPTDRLTQPVQTQSVLY